MRIHDLATIVREEAERWAATQYQYEIEGVPPVCVLDSDNPALVNYKLQCADRQAYSMVAMGDIIESLELAKRVRARLRVEGKAAT